MGDRRYDCTLLVQPGQFELSKRQQSKKGVLSSVGQFLHGVLDVQVRFDDKGVKRV